MVAATRRSRGGSNLQGPSAILRCNAITWASRPILNCYSHLLTLSTRSCCGNGFRGRGKCPFLGPHIPPNSLQEKPAEEFLDQPSARVSRSVQGRRGVDQTSWNKL